MTKTTLLSITLVFGLFSIMSCQKQDNIQQLPKPNSTNLTLARTDAKDYKIPEDTANAWAARFQQLNTTTFGGKMPIIIKLPYNGIIQLQTAAAASGIQLGGVAVHFGINEVGRITAFYTPVAINGNDIEHYDGENNYDHHSETTYDGSDPYP